MKGGLHPPLPSQLQKDVGNLGMQNEQIRLLPTREPESLPNFFRRLHTFFPQLEMVNLLSSKFPGSGNTVFKLLESVL